MTLLAEPLNGNGHEQPGAQLPQRVDAQRREIRVVQDETALANLMDTARFEHLQRIAAVMSNMSVLPEHLCMEKQNGQKVPLPANVVAANCFRITNQALRWGFDPFAIVDETFVVGGKLGYQGKLVAAVVNARAGLKTRLSYSFDGAGENRKVIVSGTFLGESEPRTADLVWKDAKTDNQMWRKDPDQKLIYSAVVKWARRHCSEVVLGVITDDDLERMSVTKEDSKPSTTDALRQLASKQNTLPDTQLPDDEVAKKLAEAEGERKIAEATAHTRGLEAARQAGAAAAQNPVIPTNPESQEDPEAEAKERHERRVVMLLEIAGDDKKHEDVIKRGLARVALGKGLKDVPWRIPDEQWAETAKAVASRTGFFAYGKE